MIILTSQVKEAAKTDPEKLKQSPVSINRQTDESPSVIFYTIALTCQVKYDVEGCGKR